MIKECISKIADGLIEMQAIEFDEKELYEYAIYDVFITISPLLIVFSIGILADMLVNGVILILPFMVIRKYSGGYHTRHAFSCFLLSCGTLGVCMVMSKYISLKWTLAGITLLAMGSLVILSPIDSENRRISVEEKKRYKKVCCMLVALFGDFIAVLFIINKTEYAACVAIGLILTAALQIPCIPSIFSNKRQ